MKYQGGKNKIARQLLEAIPRNGEVWAEPFCGGLGMTRNVDNVSRKIAADSNRYIISLWKAVKFGWLAPYVFKSEYEDIKSRPEQFPPELVAFAAVGCSFQGGWFNGYTNKTNTKVGTVRDYIEESRRGLVKLAPRLQDIEFVCCEYADLEIPAGAIIYCDPPYRDTKKYKDDFDHDKFWEWCRRKSREGHKVYISEYTAPDDFICIKEVVKSSTMDHKTTMKTTEKLFIYNGSN